jgi:hypothetical protein
VRPYWKGYLKVACASSWSTKKPARWLPRKTEENSPPCAGKCADGQMGVSVMAPRAEPALPHASRALAP